MLAYKGTHPASLSDLTLNSKSVFCVKLLPKLIFKCLSLNNLFFCFYWKIHACLLTYYIILFVMKAIQASLLLQLSHKNKIPIIQLLRNKNPFLFCAIFIHIFPVLLLTYMSTYLCVHAYVCVPGFTCTNTCTLIVIRRQVLMSLFIPYPPLLIC